MREFHHPKERPHGGFGGSRSGEGAVFQNSSFFLASHIPCPIPTFSHFLGLGYSGVFQGKKKKNNPAIFNSPGKGIWNKFIFMESENWVWSRGMGLAQGMLSRASIHGNTFPNPSNSNNFSLPLPRLGFSTRFLNGGNNSRGSEFAVEGAAQLQAWQLLRVPPGSGLQDPESFALPRSCPEITVIPRNCLEITRGHRAAPGNFPAFIRWEGWDGMARVDFYSLLPFLAGLTLLWGC